MDSLSKWRYLLTPPTFFSGEQWTCCCEMLCCPLKRLPSYKKRQKPISRDSSDCKIIESSLKIQGQGLAFARDLPRNQIVLFLFTIFFSSEKQSSSSVHILYVDDEYRKAPAPFWNMTNQQLAGFTPWLSAWLLRVRLLRRPEVVGRAQVTSTSVSGRRVWPLAVQVIFPCIWSLFKSCSSLSDICKSTITAQWEEEWVRT